MTLEPIFLEINTRYQWQKWIKNLDNGTYVLDHDKDMWHHMYGRAKLSRSCTLHLRVLRKLATWDNSEVLVRHAPDDRLWVTLRLPDHFCETCNKRIKLHRTECKSCLMGRIHRNKPFYPLYTLVSIEVESGNIERAYRVFKTLKRKHKLSITHLDCTKPAKCRHITTYFHNYRATLPPRTSKVVENVTEVARIG